jgi:hypothetical protein
MQAMKKNTETRERPDLDRRYGKIGIQAVAAAVRYQSDSKNIAYAPAEIQSVVRDDAESVAG